MSDLKHLRLMQIFCYLACVFNYVVAFFTHTLHLIWAGFFCLLLAAIFQSVEKLEEIAARGRPPNLRRIAEDAILKPDEEEA